MLARRIPAAVQAFARPSAASYDTSATAKKDSSSVFRDQFVSPSAPLFDFDFDLKPSASKSTKDSVPRTPSPWAAALLRAAHSLVGALESFLGNGSSMDVASAKPIATPLTFVAETNLPTAHGLLKVRAYRSSTGAEPIAIIAGDIRGSTSLPVRVHDACLTSEALGSLKCDCAQQLSLALKHIAEQGQGMVIYLPQEGRGIGLANKISVYAQQEKGYDTVEANTSLGFPAENRTYEAAAFILKDCGVESIALLSNNPHKFNSLTKLGVSIDARQPVLVTPNEHSANYLQVKSAKMGHGLSHVRMNLTPNKGEADLSINFRTLFELRD